MAFHERWTREAMDKYAKSVRPEAAYLPDNVKFLAENNGMDVESVRDIVFKASYMVMGLGDVYLGAPCAVPVDPLHRYGLQQHLPLTEMSVRSPRKRFIFIIKPFFF